MKRMTHILPLVTCCAALFCVLFDRAVAQQAVPLAHGPVHEAYISDTSSTLFLQAIDNQPPAAINEVQPPRCSDDAIWIPGYWTWDASINDFIWVSGVWRTAPPDHQWIAGKWQKFDSGWVWLRGFWSLMPVAALHSIANRPPDLVEETVTPKPSDDAFWISGFWHYDLRSRSYKWLLGAWETLDPSWVYVPAHYVWRDGGDILVPAYWDWPLRQRGCAYSAIAIDSMYRETIIYQPWVILAPETILDCCWMEGRSLPLGVMPWGVVKPSDLLQAIEDETGSDDPIMPADTDAAGRIRDMLRFSKGDQGTPLRPAGQLQVRPVVDPSSVSPAQGRVTIPPKPAAQPESVVSSAPSLVPPKPATFRVLNDSPKPSYIPPPTRRSPAAQSPARSHPRRRTPPSYMPPSYQPKRYTPPSRRSNRIEATSPGGPIDKSSVDETPTIDWPWRELQSDTPMSRYSNRQRIYRFEAKETPPETTPDDMFY